MIRYSSSPTAACTFAALTVLTATGSPAWAQTAQTSDAADTTLQTVIVTAQRRQQDIQQVGISITALNGKQLSELGIRDTDTIANMTPGLFAANLGSQGITTFTLRGVSQNDFSDQNESPIAMYIDGAYNSFIGDAGAAMFDVDRVEVLRGPQGTLFGRNATGGLIQIISRKPTRDFEGYGEVDFGERGWHEFQGAISGPVTDKFLARLSIETRQDDGYIRNTLGGELQGADDLSARLQFQWFPTDHFNVLVNLHGTHDNVDRANGYHAVRAVAMNGLIYPATSQAQYQAFCNAEFGVFTPNVPLLLTPTSACSGAQLSNDPYVTSVDNAGLMKRNTFGSTITATLEISDSVSLISITDYLKFKRATSLDDDATQLRQFNYYTHAGNYQYSQELRLQGQKSRLNWTAGIYFLGINDDIHTGIDGLPDAYTLANAYPGTLLPFETDNLARQDTESHALFGQTELKLVDQLSLITGVRWSRDRKHIDFDPSCIDELFPACALIARPGTVQAVGFNSATNPGLSHESNAEWSGKVELDYRPVPGWMVYGSVNRGVKGAGFNAAAIASITPALTPYRPEVLTSYEGGFKSTILAGTTRLDGDAFYYDYSNYQAYTLTGLTPTIFNTGATVRGAELQLESRPWRGLDVSFGAAYLDAMAHNVPVNLLGGRDLGDQHMPQSPPWSLDGLIRYEWLVPAGRIAVESDARYVGKRYFNTVNHPALVDDGYTIMDARVSYDTADGHWEAAVWGKNLTNREYNAMGFDLTTTNGTVIYEVSPPRWLGGSVSYRW